MRASVPESVISRAATYHSKILSQAVPFVEHAENT